MTAPAAPAPIVTFADYVARLVPNPPELPLVHTTEARWLSSIQTTQTIEPQHCTIFGEPLIYMFYGRPAYRDIRKTTPIKDVDFCPICFIFKPARNFSITRVYPFDSGASQNGLYEPEVHPSRALTAYPVQPIIESARRLISGFFETNDSYMGTDPKGGLLFSASESDAEAYNQLINGGGDPQCDDRRSAIEVQITASANLREDLLAVALPTSFLDDEAFKRNLMDVWRAHPLTYDADIGMRPTEFHSEIRKMIRAYYKLWGFA
jgi:hypothetical protein